MDFEHINWTTVTVIIIIIILIWFLFFRRPEISPFDQLNKTPYAQPGYAPDISVSNFYHELPKKQFAGLISEFANPDIVVNKPYGIAIWKNKGYYDVIMLLDESVQHNDPEPHCDFLYTIVTVYIPHDLVCMVLDLSETITYDKLKGQLSVRCQSMAANVATLYYALKIVSEPNNFDYNKSQYDELISSTINKQNYSNLENQLGQLIEQNHNIYQNELSNINLNCLIGQ